MDTDDRHTHGGDHGAGQLGTHQSCRDTHTHMFTHLQSVLQGLAATEIHTRVSSARGPLRGHAVPLQVCVRHGQQVVVTHVAADSWLGVEEPAGVVSWDGDSNVIVRRREALLDTQEPINIKTQDMIFWAGWHLR